MMAAHTPAMKNIGMLSDMVVEQIRLRHIYMHVAEPAMIL